MQPGPSIRELIPVLQIAIGPVILVSGIGLLLLTMTNRLGRVIDRSRFLWRELRTLNGTDREPIVQQLSILSKRAAILKRAIVLASVSVLLAAILIIVLFITALLNLEDAWLVATLFIGCMVALIWSLSMFIVDLNQSLLAYRLEVGEDHGV
jgi:hypothetical protein